MTKLLNGYFYPFASPVGMPFVDIDDVAAAHSLALATPEAGGRLSLSSCQQSVMLICIWDAIVSVMRIALGWGKSILQIDRVSPVKEVEG